MYLISSLRTLLATGLVVGIAGVASADSISPLEFSADLAVGESVTIEKTVVVSEGPPTDALIDVHFLIDTSGSMGSQVTAAKAAATNLFNSLNTSFGDVAAGVGVFSEGASLTDTDPKGNAIIGGGLTTDVSTFQTNVNEVTLCNPNCGDDFPESGYDAIKLAGGALDWRDGSSRFMFIFTDASAKGDLAGAQAALAADDINLVTLSYGSLATITASYGPPLGGDVYASTASADAIVTDVTAGITAGFGEYSSVTVDDLGNGLPEIEVSTSCKTADIGTCVGAEATGAFDRSEERTFTFDVTFKRVADGSTTFETYALVDGGIVAREVDSFGGAVIPAPAALPLLLSAFGGLMVFRRRKSAA